MAINYVNHAIGSGPRYGKGHGPINHISVISINKNLNEKCCSSWFTMGR